ncbi:MAG: insulinase family protein [Propionibacteriaceae bacterium]|nr:insulinase family protein [Propionibacteriaceae bacterium]
MSFAMATRTLDNGVQVTVSRDEFSPGSALNLWYRVGSADETPGSSGFAHLFEHLMFAGSAHVRGDHTEILEALGGVSNATTNHDRTNYFETVPPGALPLALWLEADRLASLRVSGTALRTQRAVVFEEKRQRYDNQPYGDQLELLLGLAFPDSHPYATPTIGIMSELDAASLDDVRAFHSTWYRPDNLHVAVVSPQSDDEVFHLVNKYLGDVPAASGPPPKRAHLDPLPSFSNVPRLTVRRPVPRSVLHLLWRTPPVAHPDRPAVAVALDIFGAGQACRLHHDLVRDAGMAEAVGAGDFGFTRGTSLSTLTVQPQDGVELPRLEATIVDHLTRLANHGPTDAEISRVRAQMEREWFGGLADAGERADAINEDWSNWGDPDHLNQHLDEWLAVTAEDVARVAATWLGPDARAVLEYEEAK